MITGVNGNSLGTGNETHKALIGQLTTANIPAMGNLMPLWAFALKWHIQAYTKHK